MTDDLALFETTTDRSYPLQTDTVAADGDDRKFGRRVTNISFTQADASDLSFEYTGETAVILGSNGFRGGQIVLCVRLGHQWYAIRPVYRIAEMGVDPNTGDDDIGNAIAIILPYTMEMITTGDYKEELDGLYQFIPKHNGNGNRGTAEAHYCVGPDLIRKAGAQVVMTTESALIGGSGNYEYTITITHPDITDTVYKSTTAPLTHVYKISGDSTLPDDLWWRFGSYANMPLWFDIESDDEDITGLYTIWPTYYNETSGTWSAQNKGYIHGTDGVRKTITQTAQLFSGSPDYFRIQITVPSGGALRYNCELPDWSNQNGDTFIFTLDTNTSSASAPDEITVRRPQTGYCRTVKEESQL